MASSIGILVERFNTDKDLGSIDLIDSFKTFTLDSEFVEVLVHCQHICLIALLAVADLACLVLDYDFAVTIDV